MDQGSANILIFLFLMLFFGVIQIIQLRGKTLRRAKRRFSEFARKFAPYHERAKVVEASAQGYMTSLNDEVRRALLEMQELTKSIDRLLDEVGCLLATNELGAAKQAEVLLDGNHNIEEMKVDCDWEVKLEGYLQKVGRSVSNASIAAKESGTPKRAKAKSTLFSLFKAGIRMSRGPYGW